MKTVQYDLRIIHRKKVAIGAINRKEIDRILQDMITSGEALNMEGGEVDHVRRGSEHGGRRNSWHYG